MKHLLAALVTLAASSAFAGPHCPPGYLNVWGACIKEGSGIFNGLSKTHVAPVVTHQQSRPHCPPPQLNVWGACVNPVPWH